ncbi:hypothetical protein GCM10028804_05750 [Larkinella terrae]
MLPAFIDYHAEGTLAHLVYRSTFEYNDRNQLLSIKDNLQSASTTSGTPWVQFTYSDERLTRINLSSISNDLDSVGTSQIRPASFVLTYADQTVNAQLFVNNREVKKMSFQLDQEGYPVKRNVTLGQLFLDAQGHLDYVAETKMNKAKNPNHFFEVLDQEYDQNQNVFADSKEYQILAALLATSNRSVADVTGLVGLDNALTTNNLRYRTIQQCTALYGCNGGKVLSETQRVNAANFPTQRSARVGAMGTFYYTITYK